MTEWRKVPLNRDRPVLEASDEGEFRIIHLTGETVVKKLDANGYVRWMRYPLIKATRALALAFPDKCGYAVVPPVSHWRDLPGDLNKWNVMKRDSQAPLRPENMIWAPIGFNPSLEAKILKSLEHLDAGETIEAAAQRAGISARTLELTVKGKMHTFTLQRRAYLIDNLKWRIPNCDSQQPGKRKV